MRASPLTRSLLLVMAWGAVTGCFSPPPPLASTGSVGDASVDSTASTAGPRRLPVDPPSYLGAIALSEDYVYFVAWRNGVYRIPKYGGEVVAIEEDTSAFFYYVAANASTVVWVRAPYDALGRMLSPVVRKQTIGETSATLFELTSDIATPPFPFFPELQITEAKVFFNNGEPATIHQVPLAGGTATDIGLPDQVSVPSWLADDQHVYYLSALSGNGCVLRRVAIEGGAPQDLAACPAGAAQFWLVALDATDAYLASEAGFWKAPKQGGDPVALFMAPAGHAIQRGLATIDDQNIYFIEMSADTPVLAATPKAGGPARTIWDGFLGGLANARQLAQDRGGLFLLGDDIGLFPKPPLP